MPAKYKVSDNAIKVMKYLNYQKFSKEDFYVFIDGRIPTAIFSMADDKSSKANEMLKMMQSVTDELTVKEDNEIDYAYINKKLKGSSF